MRILRRVTPVLLVALVVGSGCGLGEAPAVVVMTRDSAGIAIVENGPVAGNLDVWRLTEPAVLELGTLEGEPSHEFSQVVGAVRLSDGRIVVGDGGSKEARYFDSDGGHLLSVGGPGEGPGEFRFLYTVARLPGDTVVVGGWPIGWSSWYDAQGNHISDERVGPYFPGLLGKYLWDGTLLVDRYERGSHGNEIEWWAVNGEENPFRASGYITRVSRDGESMDTLTDIVGPEWFKIGRPRQGLVVHASPFGRTTLVAQSHDRLFVGETGTREIAVRRFDGSIERVIRWEGPTVSVAGGDRSAFREEVLGTLRQPNRRPDYERWLAEVPYPEVKPAFRTMIADSRGHLWVREWARANDVRDRWKVFSSEGRIIAEVEVPRDVTILGIDDAVLALFKDELDLEYVRLYHLRR
jgi:hypothetical protein